MYTSLYYLFLKDQESEVVTVIYMANNWAAAQN